MRKIFFILFSLIALSSHAQYYDYLEINNLEKYTIYKFYYEEIWNKDRDILKQNKVSKITIYDYGSVKFLSMDVNKEGFITGYRFHEQHLQSSGRVWCGNVSDSMSIKYDEQNNIVLIASIPSSKFSGSIETLFSYFGNNLTSAKKLLSSSTYTDSLIYLNGRVTSVIHNTEGIPWYTQIVMDLSGKYMLNKEHEPSGNSPDSIFYKTGNQNISYRTLKNSRINSEGIYSEQKLIQVWNYIYKPDGLIQYISMQDVYGFTHTRFYEYEYYSE